MKKIVLSSPEHPEKHFTGQVLLQPVMKDAWVVNMYRVHFKPGARTYWHSHSAGQILYIESGTCWIQKWGEAKMEIKKGEAVYIPSNEKHWHGAPADHEMIHIAVQDPFTDWNEPVSDEQYESELQK